MKIRYIILLFLSVGHLLLSCNSDDDFVSACHPTNLNTYFDSTVFEYNAEKKIETIFHYVHQSQIVRRDEFEYNESGQLIRVYRFWGYVSGPDETIELIYEGKEKPQKLSSWYGPNATPRTTYFYYDAHQRLIKREIEYDDGLMIFRYEYDNTDNVRQVYYKDVSSMEVLARENLSFDKHNRFYASSSELALFHVYVLKYEPSKNNVLSAKVYYDTPQKKFTSPLILDYEVSYNEKGLTQSSVGYGSPPLVFEYTFLDANYNCH